MYKRNVLKKMFAGLLAVLVLQCSLTVMPVFAEEGQLAWSCGTGTAEDVPEPDYNGFCYDWSSVALRDMNYSAGHSTVERAGFVWDGDYIYILLVSDGEPCGWNPGKREGNWNACCWAGPNSNGQFAITTDLGNSRLIQPVAQNGVPEVWGIDGAAARVNNTEWLGAPHCWEIVIPTESLPEYLETISFGLYQVEPVYSSVYNLHPVRDVPDSNPELYTFACDGDYGEWANFPHTLIEYDGPGIQHHEVDGEAAIYVRDGMLYGHVKLSHSDHLAELGSEFLAAVSIAFNGDYSYKDLPSKGGFYPKMVSLDQMEVVNEGYPLEKGTTTFLISDTRETTAEPGPFFGVMKITVTGYRDEMEFEMDLEKMASYMGWNTDQFQTIHARFGRIGDEWVTTGGTSTGPILGIVICAAVLCAGYMVFGKKRRTMPV